MKIPVRIAVAYSASGKWSAEGWSEATDDNAKELAVVDVGEIFGEPTIGHHFITAEIEIPDPVPVAEVEGKVDRDFGDFSPDSLSAGPGREGV